MLNVIELETRWKSYKIKSFIPHIVIIASALVIMTIGFIFIQPNNEVNIVQKEPLEIELPKEKIQEKIETSELSHNEIKQSIEQEEIKPVEVRQAQQPVQREIFTPSTQKVTLTPSMHFINEMTNDVPFYQNPDTDYENVSNTKESYKQEKAPKPEPIEEVEKPQSIKIERKDTHDDILKVIERFKKSNDPALSLFVAKKYYELGDYNKSYNYALITNELNNNIEASWIIFAKSLVKLKEKDMAVKTLRQYIEHSGSNQAKLLLEEIRSGKFK
ncbi:MAG: hypothetical protein RBR59_07595 [Sulfurimonadaceae bacterium]|jgi:tetratricopeptide (TPR) repeat protein|nr:hypothetical protein [Sulfurimonadaceae bacterium]